MKVLQRFSAESLATSSKASPGEVVRFLEEFRQLHGPARPSRLISMRVPEPLLASFKERCRIEGTPYQTRIKQLMTEWLGVGGRTR
jgi:hypothetical protein